MGILDRLFGGRSQLKASSIGKKEVCLPDDLALEAQDNREERFSAVHQKTKAVICDLDETLCTEFDWPIVAGCRLLAELESSIEVHYVTSRPETARAATERFLEENRLPGLKNLHFCPWPKSAREHKTDVIVRLAKEFTVLVSIGDAEVDEQAAIAAGVPFVRITETNVE